MTDEDWAAIGRPRAWYDLMIKHNDKWYRLEVQADNSKVEQKDIVVDMSVDQELAVPFTWNGEAYYFGIADGRYMFTSGGCEVSATGRAEFDFKPQVYTLRSGGSNNNWNDYELADNSAEVNQAYDFSLNIYPTANCEYYPDQGMINGYKRCFFTANSLGNWLVEAKATPKAGGDSLTYRARLSVTLRGLKMWCPGHESAAHQELPAGTYQNVELFIRGNNGNWHYLDKNDLESEKIKFDKAVVTKMEPTTRNVPTGNGGYETTPEWTITLAVPDDGPAEGWIEYTDTDNSKSRVTITVTPPHGGLVKETDRVIRTDSEEFRLAEGNLVTPFRWRGQTYYLATAQWRKYLNTIAPFGEAGIGTNEDEAFYAPRVFQLMSGTAGMEDASYLIREDIRQEMEQAGYRFVLDLVPTDQGCVHYPIARTVEKSSIQAGDSGNQSVTAVWYGKKFTEDYSIGLWVYEAVILDKHNRQYARNLSTCEYICVVYDAEDMTKWTDKDIETINRQIETTLRQTDESAQQRGSFHEYMVTFYLPKGDVTGEIIIPQTNCVVSIHGANVAEGRIGTKLHGGINVRSRDTTCHVENLWMIGKGKDVEWADQANRVPNEAIYGVGQGAPAACILQDYHIALHNSEHSSWGSRDSVFLNNKVAVCQNNEGGGMTMMWGNWFVGNDAAILLKKSIAVTFLSTYQNRFVNNRLDIQNESASELFVSQNYFYHGYKNADGYNWQPELWTENVDSTVSFNYNNSVLCSKNETPSFDATGNYKNTMKVNFQPIYEAFLPRFDGWSKTFAYPIARTQYCDSFFYPNWWGFWRPSWSWNNKHYPTYLVPGAKVSTQELDGMQASYYDGGEVIGTFDFTAADGGTN